MHDFLNWELHVLKRATAFKNLSAAASNIGLSQSQLSRILKKLEEHYGLMLLDRDIKRQTNWTKMAFQLVETYERTEQSFKLQVDKLSGAEALTHLRVGLLEGLKDFAIDFFWQLNKSLKLQILELHVFDLMELEQEFSRGHLDLLLSSRTPGKKKYRFSKVIGYQALEEVNSGEDTQVLSPYQRATQSERAAKGGNTVYISNSLAIRQRLANDYSCRGTLPSTIAQQKSAFKEKAFEVLLLGHDDLGSKFWGTLESAKVSLGR